MASRGEIGRIGQRRWGGIFNEEFLTELRGKKGIETYREMRDNDDVIGAIMYAIEMLLRQATFSVIPGGPETVDQEAAEFVESCLDDMQDTWTDTISEILSFMTYGWSFHEIVYKRRGGKSRDQRLNSKYSDNLIGWAKLPIRSQETLYQWEYDDSDNLLGMTQLPPPDYGLLTIPIEKAILFRTRSQKNNPEGRSLLRNAYRGWYFKRRIQEIEGIGIERDLAGFPVMTAPEGLDIWDDKDPDMIKIRTAMERIVKNIRRDSTEGLALPFGWKIELVSTGGRRNFDTNAIIERYDTRIAMTVLADFIFLGHQNVGSFALSDNKTNLFSMAVGAYLDIICEAFNNQAIPRLININGAHFANITDYPRMTHGDIEDVDLEKFGNFLSQMLASGAITPDSQLEDFIRETAHLPERIDDELCEPAAGDIGTKPGTHGHTNNPRSGKVSPEEEEKEADALTEEEVKEAEAAKKRLGRRT